MLAHEAKAVGSEYIVAPAMVFLISVRNLNNSVRKKTTHGVCVEMHVVKVLFGGHCDRQNPVKWSKPPAGKGLERL